MRHRPPTVSFAALFYLDWQAALGQNLVRGFKTLPFQLALVPEYGIINTIR